MIFDIVPNNLVDPLKGQKILQVLFLAIFFGIVLKIIVKAIPLIVFLSMAALLANTGIDSILTFSRLSSGLSSE